MKRQDLIIYKIEIASLRFAAIAMTILKLMYGNQVDYQGAYKKNAFLAM